MPERTSTQWYEDGLTLMESGFFDSVIECSDRVLQAEPGNAAAWMLKARALSGLDSYEEAIECLDAALDIDRLNVEAWREKASCLTKLGRDAEAADCEREAERIAGGGAAAPTLRKEPIARIYSLVNGLASDTVRYVAADEREAWFAYGSNLGVTRVTFHDRRFEAYTRREGLVSNEVKCVVLTPQAAWLGTDLGLSRFDRETEQWTHWTAETGLKARLVSDIVPEEQLVWLGTDEGLVVLDTATGRSVVCQGGPDPLQIDCLLSDGDRMWCGANGDSAGISLFDRRSETFEKLNVGARVQAMRLYPRGGAVKLWVARRDGLVVLDRTTYETEEIPLPEMVVTAMTVGVQSLLLGTARGLAIVEAEEGPGGNVAVTNTEIGRGQPVTALCSARGNEWIAVEGDGVLCLSYYS
jgi:ligand-binding sensor domain-containing protein